MQVIEVIYVLLPAYAANMAAPFARFWPGWNRSISTRWLGDHKTVVGFLLGVGAAVLVSLVQTCIGWFPRGAVGSGWVVAGCAQGVGAMSGDAIKSFFKRRLAIAPGHPWVPADQLDFVVGATVLAWPWIQLSPLEIVIALAFTFVGHIVVNHAAFHLGIRDTRW